MMIADTAAAVLGRDPAPLPAVVPPALAVTPSETLTAPSATNGAIVTLTSGTVPFLLLRTAPATPRLLAIDTAEPEPAAEAAKAAAHGNVPPPQTRSKSTLTPRWSASSSDAAAKTSVESKPKPERAYSS